MRLSSETTTNRSMEEISKEIRAAGQPQTLKDERAEDKKDPRVGADSPSPDDKVVIPNPASDDALVVNPEEAVIEPPTPDKLTPEEMMQNPKDLLNPSEQTPINPEADALSNHPSEGDALANEPDKTTVEQMGADPQVTQAMKEEKQKQEEAAKQHAEAND